MLFYTYLCCCFCPIGPFHLLKILPGIPISMPSTCSFLVPWHTSHTFTIYIQASRSLPACGGQKPGPDPPQAFPGPVPHTWSVLPPLFPRVDMRGLQRLLLGSGKGPFYPHGESESWGQSRVGNQSTFLQEERVRGRPGARGTGGGLGDACLLFLLRWMRSG